MAVIIAFNTEICNKNIFMKKVIKAFRNLNKANQNELYSDYTLGELERTIFPFNGGLEEGVIFKTEACVYLVPISSIVEVKVGGSRNLDQDHDDEMSDYNSEEEI